MFTDAFAEPVSAPSTDTKPLRLARALSARELLSKLEGAERDELQRAMQARDLEAVRAMIAKHAERAVIEAERGRCGGAPCVQRARAFSAKGVGSKTRAPRGVVRPGEALPERPCERGRSSEHEGTACERRRQRREQRRW